MFQLRKLNVQYAFNSKKNMKKAMDMNITTIPEEMLLMIKKYNKLSNYYKYLLIKEDDENII